MAKEIEFVFDVGSPTSYIAYMRLLRLSKATGANIVWTPILLGGLLQAIGNAAPTSLPAKEKWFFDDLELWSEKYKIPFVKNPHFPINTLTMMRGATALKGTPEFERYINCIFSSMWAAQQDMGDPAILEEALAAVDIAGPRFKALIGDVNIKSELKRATQDAVERGVFGCPTFFVDGRMYFGQDRLDFVEQAIHGE